MAAEDEATKWEGSHDRVKQVRQNGKRHHDDKLQQSPASLKEFPTERRERDKDGVAKATINALEDENETGAGDEGFLGKTGVGDEGFLGNMNSRKGELTRRNSNSNYVKEKGDDVGPFGQILKGSKSKSWAKVVLTSGGSQNGDQRLGSKRVSSLGGEGGSNVGLDDHEAEEVFKESFSKPDPEADKGVGRKENTFASWANSLDKNFNLGRAINWNALGDGVSDGAVLIAWKRRRWLGSWSRIT
ncbi:hypothetical protein V6N12_070025 [Hibiscus sabdariffa]|uniref:Uncharacterized protein n=1 Tax=Hibiscus sabdariffa TaxID=183260 RepID=A0ABR2FFL9_9ROSI